MVNSGASNEGKGLLAGHVAKDYDVHVRVGAANAGHTLYTSYAAGWEKHVVQQLPCAAYANPDAALVLGAGAMISPEILLEEINTNRHWRKSLGLPELQVLIDGRAHVITDEHKQHEAESGLAEAIGSTSTIAREGIGAAQAARVMREDYCLFQSYYEEKPTSRVIRVADTVTFLHYVKDSKNILLEGTQGISLSNTTGIYPYVTSRNTSAPGLLADCGLATADEVLMVCRCHPIRVAGNSGPFWSDSREISWEDIGISSEQERTTVTKKVRRVATFSYEQVAYNAKINGATQIALTFADYVWAALAGDSTPRTKETDWPELGPMIQRIETETGVPVKYIGTGPYSVIERGSQLD